MAELRDPEKPAGWVEIIDGRPIRNDGVELKPANENRWYVLMTIAGEIEGSRYSDETKERIAQNRRYWNAWACSEMSEDARAALAEKMDLNSAELAPWTDAEQAEVAAQFHARLGAFDLPAPTRGIDLSEIHFSSTVVLEKWIFSEYTDFQSATFSEYADFQSATFSRGAFFQSATFSGEASFLRATFSGSTVFQSATFSIGAFFQSASFSGYVDFSNETFGGQTVFTDTQFLGDVPKFYQRTFHEDTDFTSEEASRATHWPEITAANARESRRAYTRLAQVMSQLHKPDDEQFFRRQELRCKAMEGRRWHRLTFKLYEWVSLYGYSYERPLLWLLATILGGAAAFTTPAARTAQDWGEILWAFVDNLGPSFSGTFAFLGFLRRFHGGFFQANPWWFETVSGVQTILGVVLLFFLGLGLRNRFRLK